MSELTKCNYCTLQDMRERAERRGVYVILKLDKEGWTTARYSDQERPSHHFLELTDRCVC